VRTGWAGARAEKPRGIGCGSQAGMTWKSRVSFKYIAIKAYGFDSQLWRKNTPSVFWMQTAHAAL
jgi:hypothetical protein